MTTRALPNAAFAALWQALAAEGNSPIGSFCILDARGVH